MDEFASAFVGVQHALRRYANAASAIAVHPDWLSTLHRMCPELVPPPPLSPLPSAPSSDTAVASLSAVLPSPQSAQVLSSPSSSELPPPSALSSPPAPPPVPPTVAVDATSSMALSSPTSSTALSFPPSASSSKATPQHFDCVSIPVTNLCLRWPSPEPLPSRPPQPDTQVIPQQTPQAHLPTSPLSASPPKVDQEVLPQQADAEPSPSRSRICYSCPNAATSRRTVLGVSYPGQMCGSCYNREYRILRQVSMWDVPTALDVQALIKLSRREGAINARTLADINNSRRSGAGVGFNSDIAPGKR
ncbi:hypothetical protein CF319_g5021 [Tilletia indica]|uniref:Uncharacterized protein n=1 Tax=Tilletia indica TaxID=43049 RepID=A0A177TEE8_9BASI|nr:hypothetical protein CF319_g5021 [Tilletia indica]KAE8250755.1 hypothetical protein A4X13_0g4413 [Tilletia indica]